MSEVLDKTAIDWDYPNPFIVEVSVKPQHIDEFQHTNNVVYLTWMAHAAWRHSIELGLDFEAYKKFGKGMVVRHHDMDYVAPSFLDETIWIATWITQNDKRLRLRRRFQMVNAHTGKTLLRGSSDFVCINIDSGKATRMPKEFINAYALTADVPTDQTK
ncbi:MAG: acyl-CoA thioester hydrolase [Parvibaculaceae bacterium]|jgi:acyl-CoA thioester hydrolase|nr:thioesterase family protein [Parvibaculaceae bacterium]|tara:strand:- start:147 stop:623 length:477 start_codon:yes stop_codon:yes gene_type:complete